MTADELVKIANQVIDKHIDDRATILVITEVALDIKRIADALEDVAHRLFHIEGVMKKEE